MTLKFLNVFCPKPIELGRTVSPRGRAGGRPPGPFCSKGKSSSKSLVSFGLRQITFKTFSVIAGVNSSRDMQDSAFKIFNVIWLAGQTKTAAKASHPGFGSRLISQL